MTWQKEVDQIHHRRRLAEACGGPQAVEKHHSQGKLTIRERIGTLVDQGSFREVGKLAGRATYQNNELTNFEPAP